MKENELFYFRAGECLAAMEAKNTARALLSNQLKLRYPKGRRPTPEEYRAITQELRTVSLGVEKLGENIYDYKIRKHLECKELILKTSQEFPGFRHILNSLIKERSVRIGSHKMERERAKQKLKKSLLELITPFKENCFSYYEVVTEIVHKIPHVKDFYDSKTTQLSPNKIHYMDIYHNDKFNETIDFLVESISPFYDNNTNTIDLSLSEEPPYLLSEPVLYEFKRLFFYKDKDKALKKLHTKLEVRMQRFMTAYLELKALS